MTRIPVTYGPKPSDLLPYKPVQVLGWGLARAKGAGQVKEGQRIS